MGIVANFYFQFFGSAVLEDGIKFTDPLIIGYRFNLVGISEIYSYCDCHLYLI